ncbi:EamA family transporter RarD [Aldersonia sp. NBC_00410]|uniref:EamA family transporter RarD n=1 Tax=Aldersonia sp. NBC_00410 TaxID=2975954 RepID=UPI002255A6D2|nr:EamA family transporter RarD [Aldersonia sp. NBC_00410]MCX5046018.1 EamA family transporter RarD [Aldersonia sp. NBC_00410]
MKRPWSTPVSAGLAAGAGAYLLWGLFPAYFGLLKGVGALEVLASRIVFTLVVMLIVLAVLGRLAEMLTIAPRTWLLAAAASAAISVNWGMYVYGVATDRVVECALGYFINPLVSVMLGVVIFRERLTRAQVTAVALGAVAVIVLTVDYGSPPVIALTLACSFATYGLIKKVVPLDPLRSLTAEGIVGAPFALGYLVFLAVTGAGAFVTDGLRTTLLLIGCGPITTIPLLLFGAAAQRVPLSTMGLMQYLTPALQMAWGIAVVHESMPASRWIGFALIWLALAIFTTDALRRARRTRLSARGTEPAESGAPGAGDRQSQAG